jgi:hypothetical protein
MTRKLTMICDGCKQAWQLDVHTLPRDPLVLNPIQEEARRIFTTENRIPHNVMMQLHMMEHDVGLAMPVAVYALLASMSQSARDLLENWLDEASEQRNLTLLLQQHRPPLGH